jgi:hypothetical protein
MEEAVEQAGLGLLGIFAEEEREAPHSFAEEEPQEAHASISRPESSIPVNW